MTSTINAQDFQFVEPPRPETSKCSRGVVNKFNKTLTGFHMQESSNSNQAVINNPYSNFSNNCNQNSNEPGSQRAMMNSTGFSFKQHKQQDANKFINANVETKKIEKISMLPSSQGRRQNSFSSGITLEQYFQNPSDNPQNQSSQQSNSKGGEQSEASQQKRINQQSYDLSDMKLVDEQFQDKRMRGFEEEYEDGDGDNQYDDEEFEIHEASDEEEEEEDYVESRKRRRRRKAESLTGDSNSGKENVKRGVSRQENNSKQSTNKQPKEQQMQGQAKEQNLNSIANSHLNDTKRISKHEEEEEEKNFGNEEMVMQKKIRDKYYKKTIIHKQYIATPSQQNQGNKNSQQNIPFASNNNSSIPGQNIHALSSILNNSNSSTYNQSVQQTNGNNNNPNININNNPNINNNNTNNINNNININTNNNSNNVNANSNLLNQTKQKQSQTQHNFYIQQYNSGNAGYLPSNNIHNIREEEIQQYQQYQQQYQPGNNNNQQYNFNPSSNQYVYSNSISRKANRSQSPLQSFKRQSNLGHSQQRRVSKQDQDNSPDNQMMRQTFNNTSRTKNGFNQGASTYTANQQHSQQQHQQSQFDNIPSFRTSFYSKLLTQKDKIQEVAKEDANYITKYAARFHLNPEEIASIKQKN